MKLIDKDTLVAEIRNKLDSYKGDGIVSISVLKQHCEDFIDSLNTLEVKGVDLDEEADNYWGTLTSDVRNSIYFNDFYKFAKHFFELGMQVSNKA